MTQGQPSSLSLIESDRIEGTPIYAREGKSIGNIKRLIIDKASGRVVYVVITFSGLAGLDDVSYVIPWAKLWYSKRDGGYHTEMTEADFRSTHAQGGAITDFADPESVGELEAYFRIPPGWRSV